MNKGIKSGGAVELAYASFAAPLLLVLEIEKSILMDFEKTNINDCQFDLSMVQF